MKRTVVGTVEEPSWIFDGSFKNDYSEPSNPHDGLPASQTRRAGVERTVHVCDPSKASVSVFGWRFEVVA
jgi:hypothetical protein